MTPALAAVVVAVWLLGGHVRDDRLGRAVRLWMGPGVAVALVADGMAVSAVLVVGLALLAATLVACARRGSAGLPIEMRNLLVLAENEARSRYVRELRSTISGPIAIPDNSADGTAHG